MNQTHPPVPHPAAPSRDDLMSALFANLILQQANMALMLMGRVPNPETGERVRDLEASRMFIDQLEMLEAKTKGNLSKEEEQLLRQNLTTLRMAFVEAVHSESAGVGTNSASGAAPHRTVDSAPPTEAQPSATAPGSPSSDSPEEEHRKKFSKKY